MRPGIGLVGIALVGFMIGSPSWSLGQEEPAAAKAPRESGPTPAEPIARGLRRLPAAGKAMPIPSKIALPIDPEAIPIEGRGYQTGMPLGGVVEGGRIVDLPPEIAAQLPELDAIRPLPGAPIPVDPPPHEGALFDLPITIEPPDLLTVEFLEALPGRPITGERLVRPDGTISLGFYGHVHVRGLTIPQAKTKIILHMRDFLSDEVQGLVGTGFDGQPIAIAPEDSDRVFVDIAKYNYGVYYVQGEVAAPGRLPWTGGETVLDAVNYAGDVTPIADPTAITLVRPARGGASTRTYPIDLDAIRKGDAMANLQIFPGDRILVGRHPVVRSTIELERLVAPVYSILNTISNAASAAQRINTALDERKVSPDRRAAIIKELVDRAWKASQRGEGEPLGEEEFKRMVDLLLNPGE